MSFKLNVKYMMKYYFFIFETCDVVEIEIKIEYKNDLKTFFKYVEYMWGGGMCVCVCTICNWLAAVSACTKKSSVCASTRDWWPKQHLIWRVSTAHRCVECQRWGRKKEDMGRAGGNTVLSLKRVDTKKHDYLEKTGSALTVLMGWMTSVFSWQNVITTTTEDICSGFRKI